MKDIKFGTDGWRAIIGDKFTIDNVNRISVATSLWLLREGKSSIVIGHDTRFGGSMFCEAAIKVFVHYGIQVYTDTKVVTTPMISYAAKTLDTGLGVMITASHNPPNYNGYKLKSSFGGPADVEIIKQIESLIPQSPIQPEGSFADHIAQGKVKIIDLEGLYIQMLGEHFKLDELATYSSQLAYDSMYGAGEGIMKKIFPGIHSVHPHANPGFDGISPEPIDKNLHELSGLMKSGKFLLGIANDGDADRIGLYDEKGRFIDSHHILLLLLYYLVEYKQYAGKVIASAAVTEKLQRLAESYALDFEYTKIGFKHITPLMIKEDVLLAGEEAGGMAIKSHLPERDGIYNALIILEMIHVSGKTLSELVSFLYAKVGFFSYDRIDMKLDPGQKKEIVTKCEHEEFDHLAGEKITDISLVDGYRYFLGEDKWIMIRPSGTEPVVRFYAQARNSEEVRALLKTTIFELTGIDPL